MEIVEIDYTDEDKVRYQFIIGSNAYFFTGKELWRIVEKYLQIQRIIKWAIP